MFDSIFGRMGNSRAWRSADPKVAELPALLQDGPQMTNQLILSAGGLALVLSRHDIKQAQREYPNAYELYQVLRRDLKRYGRTTAGADLMLDALHEVAQVLDPLSRKALLYCLDARREQDKRKETAKGGAKAAAPEEPEKAETSSMLTSKVMGSRSSLTFPSYLQTGAGYEVQEVDLDEAQFASQMAR